MRAVLFEQHGPLENLRYVEDFPEPEAGPGECLVRVRAAALNGFDPMILRGIPGLKIPLPMVPGGDIAGEIAALGSGVDDADWSVGDRVSVMPLLPPKMIGETLRGGCCEYISVPATHLIRIPDGVSYEQAACLPVAYGTARRMMVTRGGVSAGESVLILGATGGVGTCCVQLAKAAGAEVVACGSSKEKTERLKALGADHVVDTSSQDFVEEAHRLYGKPRVWGESGGVDVIVNYIGGETWAKSLKALKRDGRMLTCGATAGFNPPTDIRYIWSFEQRIIGSNGWTADDQAALLQMVADGRIDPVIDSVRPLAQMKISMQELIDRKVFGKAVLTV
ncbi:MAG TPA: zinc-binding dehydrogenase [Candidatus Dormibacteraeota bacterium]|nr:zinc-binding dehydrogenase [Candidatus Dormibacteraeota bacterium]